MEAVTSLVSYAVLQRTHQILAWPSSVLNISPRTVDKKGEGDSKWLGWLGNDSILSNRRSYPALIFRKRPKSQSLMIKYHHTLKYFTSYLYWNHEIQTSNVTACHFKGCVGMEGRWLQQPVENPPRCQGIKTCRLTATNASTVWGHGSTFPNVSKHPLEDWGRNVCLRLENLILWPRGTP